MTFLVGDPLEQQKHLLAVAGALKGSAAGFLPKPLIQIIAEYDCGVDPELTLQKIITDLGSLLNGLRDNIISACTNGWSHWNDWKVQFPRLSDQTINDTDRDRENALAWLKWPTYTNFGGFADPAVMGKHPVMKIVQYVNREPFYGMAVAIRLNGHMYDEAATLHSFFPALPLFAQHTSTQLPLGEALSTPPVYYHSTTALFRRVLIEEERRMIQSKDKCVRGARIKFEFTTRENCLNLGELSGKEVSVNGISEERISLVGLSLPRPDLPPKFFKAYLKWLPLLNENIHRRLGPQTQYTRIIENRAAEEDRPEMGYYSERYTKQEEVIPHLPLKVTWLFETKDYETKKINTFYKRNQAQIDFLNLYLFHCEKLNLWITEEEYFGPPNPRELLCLTNERNQGAREESVPPLYPLVLTSRKRQFELFLREGARQLAARISSIVQPWIPSCSCCKKQKKSESEPGP